MIDQKTHKLLNLLGFLYRGDLILKICGDILLVKNVSPIDASIYNEDGGWTCQVVLFISDRNNKFHRPGNGMDFYENDLQKIVDANTLDTLFEQEQARGNDSI